MNVPVRPLTPLVFCISATWATVASSAAAAADEVNGLRKVAEEVATLIDEGGQAQDKVRELAMTVEQSRAQSLLDQMRLQGTDIWDWIPPAKTEVLRANLEQKRAAVVSLQERVARQPNNNALDNKLAEARKQLVAAERDVWTAARERWPLASDPRDPIIPLRDLRQRAARERCLVFQYLLGVEGGYVLVIAPLGQPVTIERLSLTDQQAQKLGVGQPGPLTADRLGQALMGDDGFEGVVKMLSEPGRPVPADRLFALWEAMIPKRVQELLTEGKAASRLVIIPDGPLALLLFDALVTNRPPSGAADCTYLLDLDTPVFYAPSATILMRLAQRPPPPAQAADEPVLSVAKSNYQNEHPVWENLDHTAPESRELVKNFQGVQQACLQLLDEVATEANLQRQLPGRRIVHLACHGYARLDQQNLSGALLLSKPRSAQAGSSDDGYLMLAEIALGALQGCELALLSACQTNIGPHQRGEGVWAFSRAFLAAGARRVVATNWNVDDEAARSLVGEFSQRIAAALEPNADFAAVEYTQHLHAAKLSIRRDNKWRKPYYWAGFQLMGYEGRQDGTPNRRSSSATSQPSP